MEEMSKRNRHVRKKDVNDMEKYGDMPESINAKEEYGDIPADKEQTEPVSARRNYKDTVFRLLFREKRELLSLFNAINGTKYENPDELEVNTLENAIYMSMKNDISCVLDMRLNLYEHQSTENPNMPLRDLFYVSRLYEKMTKDADIYSTVLIRLPTPKFVVLYNGEKDQPDRKEMRLSEAFMVDTGEKNLELVVLQLNINAGYNKYLAEQCRTLYEYEQYVDRVRAHRNIMYPIRWTLQEKGIA